MTIRELITELEKLEVLHGDLPVTYADWEHPLHGDSDDILVEFVKLEDRKHTEGIGGFTATGPHAHLS